MYRLDIIFDGRVWGTRFVSQALSAVGASLTGLTVLQLPGASYTVVWNTEFASGVTFDGVTVAASGSRSFLAAAAGGSRTHTLVAQGVRGPVTRTVTVETYPLPSGSLTITAVDTVTVLFGDRGQNGVWTFSWQNATSVTFALNNFGVDIDSVLSLPSSSGTVVWRTRADVGASGTLNPEVSELPPYSSRLLPDYPLQAGSYLDVTGPAGTVRINIGALGIGDLPRTWNF